MKLAFFFYFKYILCDIYRKSHSTQPQRAHSYYNLHVVTHYDIK